MTANAVTKQIIRQFRAAIAADGAGDHEVGDRAYRRAIELDDGTDADVMGAPDLPPLRLRPYLSYAHSLYERGNAAAALAVLETAVVRWPNDADLHMLAGSCHQSLENWDDAVLAFQRSNLSEPRPYVCILLASSLDKLGRRAEARHWLEHSLVVDPNYEESYYNLGYVLERKAISPERASTTVERSSSIPTTRSRKRDWLHCKPGCRPRTKLPPWL
jgi:tetratricopeptide (TPR) repeat protein